MHFTKSPLKQKKPVTNGTNKMGQYYSTIRVPIKNHHTTPIANRIDKNMTSLAVPEQPTNINLDDMLSPITSLIEPFVIEEIPKINMHLKSVNLLNEDSMIKVVSELKEFYIKESVFETSMKLREINATGDDTLVNVISDHKENYMKERVLETSMKLGEINATGDDTLVNVVSDHKENYMKVTNSEITMKLGEIDTTGDDTLVNVVSDHKENYMKVTNSEITMKLGEIDTGDDTLVNMHLKSVNLLNEDSIINVVSNHKENYMKVTNSEITMKLGELDATGDNTLLNVVSNHKENYMKVKNAEITMKLGEIDATGDNTLLNVVRDHKETNIKVKNAEITMKLGEIDATGDNTLLNVVSDHKENYIKVKNSEITMKLGEIDATGDDTLLNVVNNHKENYMIQRALETSMKFGEINATSMTGNAVINELNENIHRKEQPEPELGKEEKLRNQEIEIPLTLLQLTKPIIENVYQERYNNNINATGLGDFIRGSYFLLEFCDNHNIPCNINILNHPVSQFFEMYKNKQPLVYNNINKFELTNFNPHISHENIITNISSPSINDDLIKYLSKQSVFNKKLYIYTIAYPASIIPQKHKEYMKRILAPSMRIKSLVDKMVSDLELVSKNFTIIHIRYGDDFLIQHKEKFKKSHLEMIQNTLDKLNLNTKYLLISDNTKLKNYLSLKYPFLKIHLNEITHTGEGIQLETNKLQNTMIDFNLFSRASNVIAFSVYPHGTGFSRWASETYSVPYSCKHLN
jgi:hypothetical protein